MVRPQAVDVWATADSIADRDAPAPVVTEASWAYTMFVNLLITLFVNLLTDDG